MKSQSSLVKFAVTFLLLLSFCAAAVAAEFRAASNNGVGTHPVAIVVGDFDGDGRLDAAVANSGSNNLSVLLGNGDCTLRRAVNYRVGMSPQSVAVGDFNGDGTPDLAVANSASNAVSVLLGKGDGTFQRAHTYPVGAGPQALAVGDFNNDGKTDLAVANSGSNEVGLMFGNGDGTFRRAVNRPVGSSPQSLVVADFNGDGLPNLAVANSGGHDLSVLLRTGKASLQRAQNYRAGENPEFVAAGDFDGDGKPDLAVINHGGKNIAVFLAKGDGTFQKGTSYTAGTIVRGLVIGDFDADHRLGLAVANPKENSVSMLSGLGNGSFLPGMSFTVGASPSALAVGDFNGDGAADLAVTNSADNTVTVLLNSPVLTLSPKSLKFGVRPVGSHSPAMTVTLTNRGSAPLNITSIRLAGKQSQDFVQTNTCAQGTLALAANQSCTVQVTFSPAAMGTRKAALKIIDNTAGSPHSVGLTGGDPTANTVWTGGAGNWSDGSKWTNGVPTSATDALIDNANPQASPVSLDVRGAQVNNLTIDSNDSLSFPDFTSLAVNGASISNAGNIFLNSGGNNTELDIEAAVTLSGAGAVTLSDNPANAISIQAGGLTNQSTIQGAGTIQLGASTMTNQGTINATGKNHLIITGNGASPFSNTKTLEATGGGTLELQSVYNNAGGTVKAGNSSTVVLVNATINGGTLTTGGSGAIQSNCCLQASTLNGVANSGTFQVGDNSGAWLAGTISNTGSIQINSTGNTSSLNMSGPVTLKGTGAVTLSDHSSNILSVQSAGASLVNKNPIQGAGAITVGGPNTLTNQGTINANSASNNQLIVTNNGTFTNTATLQATNGGILNLAGSFNNTGGTISAGNGSIVTLVNATISGGTLSTSGAGAIQSNCCLQTSILNGLKNTGTFKVGDQSSAHLAGTVTNNGSIQVNATGQGTSSSLVMDGTVTLKGTGALTMSDNPDNSLGVTSSGASLLNQSIIQGAGTIIVGNSPNTLTNQGTISATSATGNQLIVRADGTFANTATLQATNGGTLVLEGTFNNTGGTISAGNGTTVQLVNGIVNGGTLTSSGTGAIQSNCCLQASTLNGVTNAGTFQMGDNSQGNYLAGTITNTGSIQLNSTGHASSLNMSGAVTLMGSGSVTMSDNPNNGISLGGAGASLVNQSTIQGAGTIQLGNNPMTNRGTMVANVSNPLLINGNGSFTNKGNLKVNAGRLLQINSLFSNFSGTTLSGGKYFVSGMLQFSGANIVKNAANITLNGANSQIIDQNGADGLANLASNGVAGIFTLQGGRNFATSRNFTNNGTVMVASGSKLTVHGAGNYKQLAGTTIVEGVLKAHGLINILAGALFGTNTLAGNVQSAGTITPGDSPTQTGQLAVTGSYTQVSTGSLDIGIAGVNAGTQYGQLNVTAGASLGGTLNLSLLNGFVPSVGQTFTILNASSVSGTFAAVNGACINSSEHFTVTYDPGDVVLTVVSGPCT